MGGLRVGRRLLLEVEQSYTRIGLEKESLK